MRRKSIAGPKWIFYAMVVLGFAASALIFAIDRIDAQRDLDAWRATLAATVPRHLTDGNLIKVDTLLKAKSEFPTAVLSEKGQFLISTGSFDTGGPGFFRLQLIQDSRLVGWLITPATPPLGSSIWKYTLVLALWISVSAVAIEVLQRKSDIRFIDKLTSYLQERPESAPELDTYAVRKHLVPLASAVSEYKITQERLKRAALEEQKNRIQAEIFRQVAHDIRSPLAALDAVLGAMTTSSNPDREIVLNAVRRIRVIANGLLQKGQSASTDPAHGQSATLAGRLAELLTSIVAEKRLEYSAETGVALDLVVEPGAQNLAAHIQAVDFTRMISNLINNAIEAIPSGVGQVVVQLRRLANGAAEITVSDTGKGIPEEIFPKLMRQGATFGKPSGNGLGLWHAKQKLSEWGGGIKIESSGDKGTVVALTLPAVSGPLNAEPVSGEPPVASLHPDALLLDDDPLVAVAWKYAARVANKDLHVFHAPSEFEKVLNSYSRHVPVYVDSSLGIDIPGEVWAKRLADAGFREIYLATGYAPGEEFLKSHPWIKAVVGKDPPWRMD